MSPWPRTPTTCPEDTQNGLGEQASGHIPIPQVGKLSTERMSVWSLQIWQAWAGPGQPRVHPTVPKPCLRPHCFKNKTKGFPNLKRKMVI